MLQAASGQARLPHDFFLWGNKLKVKAELCVSTGLLVKPGERVANNSGGGPSLRYSSPPVATCRQAAGERAYHLLRALVNITCCSDNIALWASSISQSGDSIMVGHVVKNGTHSRT